MGRLSIPILCIQTNRISLEGSYIVCFLPKQYKIYCIFLIQINTYIWKHYKHVLKDNHTTTRNVFWTSNCLLLLLSLIFIHPFLFSTFHTGQSIDIWIPPATGEFWLYIYFFCYRAFPLFVSLNSKGKESWPMPSRHSWINILSEFQLFYTYIMKVSHNGRLTYKEKH